MESIADILARFGRPRPIASTIQNSVSTITTPLPPFSGTGYFRSVTGRVLELSGYTPVVIDISNASLPLAGPTLLKLWSPENSTFTLRWDETNPLVAKLNTMYVSVSSVQPFELGMPINTTTPNPSVIRDISGSKIYGAYERA